MILRVPYSTWKEVVQANSFPVYYIVGSTSTAIAWCGNAIAQYRSDVDVNSYDDWNNTFGNAAIEVLSDDDAVAHIIGIDNPSPQPVLLDGTPREKDGRVNIVNAPMTHGMSAWWTGSGDDLDPTPPSSGRGEGEELNFTFTTSGEQTRVLDFSSFVEIYDGEGIWHPIENWSIFDRFWVGAYIPSNQDHVIANESNEGNCNVVNTGQGFSIIVPAAGNGAYDVDLTKAHPAPASAGSQINYWHTGSYHLESATTYSVDQNGNPTGDHALFYDLAFWIPFCVNMPMGSPTGKFEIDSDKSEPLHKNWQIHVKCKRVSEGVGYFGVWLKFFRPNTVEYVFGS